jgi:hypothetical protein
VRAPLVETVQDGSVRIHYLTARRCLGLAEERLVPLETAGNIPCAADRPCAFHRIGTAPIRRGKEHDPVHKSVYRNLARLSVPIAHSEWDSSRN